MAAKSGLSRNVRTGIFVLIGVVVFMVALFVLGARQQLFQSRVKIYSMYPDVAGLQEGAFVRISGINVGTVSRISLPDTIGKIVAEFNIRGDALSQIREDSRAVIGTEGLIGARIVMISQGSPHARPIAAGDTIVGQSPLSLTKFQDDIDEALNTLPDLMVNVGMTIASLRSVSAKIDQGQGTIGKLVNETSLHDSVLTVVRRARTIAETADNVLRRTEMNIAILTDEYASLAESLRTATGDIRSTANQTTLLIRDLREGRGTMGKLITDDSLYVVMTRMAASGDTMINLASDAIKEIAQASYTVAQAAQQAGVTVQAIAENLERGEGTIGKLLVEDTTYVRLNRILLNLQIASEKAAVNMEAMRTNWLFRGYFDEQGYWDNIDRQIELQEQRAIRLREWEDRLLRIQESLREMELQLEEQESSSLTPISSEMTPQAPQ